MNIHSYNLKDFLSRSYNDVEEFDLFKLLKYLPSIEKNKVWIAGGAIRRTLLGQELESDVDLFFKNESELKKFRIAFEKLGANKMSENNHQMTYSYYVKELNKEYIIQFVIINYYINIEALLDSFDFTITQFAFDGEKLHCNEFSLWDLKNKRLALHKLTYGVATMRRMIKYTKQGFTACAGTMASILEATVENPEVIQSDIQYID